jgi:hypothetical protein
LRYSFRIQLQRCEPNIPKLKNKKEQGGLKAALLSGEMIRKLSITYIAGCDGFESDSLTRSFP